jgi:hypothetical protein
LRILHELGLILLHLPGLLVDLLERLRYILGSGRDLLMQLHGRRRI